MLSVHPLTIGVVASQIIYILIFKKKKYLIFISLALIIYILFNFNYIMKGLSGGLTPGHTKLQLNFFLSYYFNVFFGNKYFGAFYLILFFCLCLFNFKKIFKEQIILYSIIIIFLSYLMIILGYFFSFHIAAPRYIEFILPFIILFFIYNFNEAIIKINKEYCSYSKLLIFIIVILNIFITNDNKPVKKPSTKNALNIIKSNNIQHIYTNYDQYFSTYLKSINYFKNNNFLLLDDNKIIQKTDVFAFLCLKEGKSNAAKNEIYDNKQCQKEFYNFTVYKIIDLDDYKIILYKNN
jgi:hypothetical protein